MAIEQAPPEPDLRDSRRPRRELNTLLWLCGWGGVTAIALTAFAITSQTETAGERLRLIFGSKEVSAVARMPPRIAQLEAETQLLTAQVRALTADHDRLVGRIALLESSIDDMTGTIKRQAVATAAALAAKADPPVPSAPPTALPASLNPSAPNAANASTPALTAAITPAPKAGTSTTPAIPLPPTRVAAAAANELEPPAPNQNEFGLDLGGGATVDAVRQRWAAAKANFGPLLRGMYPLAAREQRVGANGYRLVVGPLPNSAAATGLCAHFTAARTACRAVRFDGEQIAQH